jgi:hypothetical protein
MAILHLTNYYYSYRERSDTSIEWERELLPLCGREQFQSVQTIWCIKCVSIYWLSVSDFKSYPVIDNGYIRTVAK